jgi:hypothetical protein
LQTIKNVLKSSVTFKFTVVQQLDIEMSEGGAERMTDFALGCNTVELIGAEMYAKRNLKCEPHHTLILY